MKREMTLKGTGVLIGGVGILIPIRTDLRDDAFGACWGYNPQMAWFPLITFLCSVAVIPLTDSQRAQLATAGDFNSRFDEGALYPLLHNAAQWKANDESGARVPDYAAILASPEKHRGELFLIEGLFAGGARTIARESLTRSGPWDDQLQQWVLVTDQARDEVAAVYLVNPPRPPTDPPRVGVRVRTAARFYKVLRDQDTHGQPTDYLTFVGYGARITADDAPTGTRLGTVATPFLLVVISLAVGWYLLRRNLRTRPLLTRARRQRSIGNQPTPDDYNQWHHEPGRPIADNPVEALEILEHGHHQDPKQ